MRRESRRRLPILVLLLVVLVAVAAGADALEVPSLGGTEEKKLDGVTAREGVLELRLDDGRVESVDTDLSAICRGGYGWKAHWSPSRRDTGTFRQDGRRFVVRETKEETQPDGSLQRVTVLMRGELSGDGSSGAGSVWLTGRFYRGSTQTQACESGPVRWVAGDHGRELATPQPGPRTAYPKVPSLAKGASPARLRFIRRVDATCARTYNAGIARSQALALKLGDGPEAQARVYADYLEWHGDQVEAVGRLGPPPEAAGQYRAWLGNMARRVALERRALRRHRAGDRQGVARDYAEVGRLKKAGNEAGQVFGLQVCTSNGPDRTPAAR